jgi:hypothetical protein
VTVADPADVAPTRMLNEYVYCPRPFFLEWVGLARTSNTDVTEENADTGVRTPEEERFRYQMTTRSVELASERLGITAKPDPLEGTNGGVGSSLWMKMGRAVAGRDASGS